MVMSRSFQLPNLPVTWRFCKVNGKAPFEKNWGNNHHTAQDIQRAIDEGQCTGYGLLTGVDNLLAVDVDGPQAKARLLELTGGEIPGTIAWTSTKPSCFQ